MDEQAGSAETKASFEAIWQTLAQQQPTTELRPCDSLRPTVAPSRGASGGAKSSPWARTQPLRPLTGTTPQEQEICFEGKLGEGGMGMVYEARQLPRERDVAVKRLRPSRRDPESRRALLQEAWVTGLLEHPNVVPVHTLGADEQ